VQIKKIKAMANAEGLLPPFKPDLKGKAQAGGQTGPGP